MSAATDQGAERILSPHIWVFYGAFVLSFLLTPLMWWVATALGITDKPDQSRKLHKRPVPYLGGVAIFAGWLAGLVISRWTDAGEASVFWSSSAVMFSGIITAAALIVLLGLGDDIRGIGPLAKILGQLGASIILLVCGIGLNSTRPTLGWIIEHVFLVIHQPNPLNVPVSPHWFEFLVRASGVLFTFVVIVGACNATNLMDGLDGLCGGVTAIIAGSLLFICVHVAMSDLSSPTTNTLRLVISLAMLGGVLGFVPFNFSPASIFMGDTGSMFLGFSCGVLMLLLAEVQSKWFLAAMVVFALPVLDTSLAFARRWIAGRPLFSADAQHFHHQLLRRGLSVRQTALVGYALTIVFALLAAAMVFMRSRFAVAFYLVIFCCIVVAAYKMGMIHERSPRRRSGRRPMPQQAFFSEDFDQLLSHVAEPEFRDLLIAVWQTGCRSRDLFAVEARHFDPDNKCWCLPSLDLRGRPARRIISLNAVALAITERLADQHRRGPLFRDPAGRRWTRESCRTRFARLTPKLGRRVSLLLLRQGPASAMLSSREELGIRISRDQQLSGFPDLSPANGS